LKQRLAGLRFRREARNAEAHGRAQDADEAIQSFEGLPVAGAWSGGLIDDGEPGATERDDDVVAHDDGVRAAARRLHRQRGQFQLRSTPLDKGGRDRNPDRSLADKAVKVGNCSGRNNDKFKRFGLTPFPARHIRPPLIEECFCNLECRVRDTRLVKRYNLFILEVLKAWMDPSQKHPKTLHHRGYGSFTVDGAIIKLRSRMR
jgi:hypothetical protein